MKTTAPIVLLSSPRGVRRHLPKRRASDAPLSAVTLDECAGPLVAGLGLNGAAAGSLEAVQGHAMLVRHVLARTPVLIVVDGNRETFDAVHSFFNALLSVRARMFRSDTDAPSHDQVRPLNEDGLRRILGGDAEPAVLRDVVMRGDVYLVHESERARRRNTLDRVRRCVLPNAFRYVGDLSGDDAARDWLAVLSGGPSLAIGSNVADALANLEALRTMAVADSGPGMARAGSEMAEHRTMKALLAEWATGCVGGENVHVEERIVVPPARQLGLAVRRLAPARPGGLMVIPDIRMRADAGEFHLEVETLRGIAAPGVDAMIAFEEKLRARVEHAAAAGAAHLWVVLSPDCLVLAAGPLNEMHARLQRQSSIPLVFCTVDYATREPVLISFVAREPAVSLTDGAWSVAAGSEVVSTSKLTLADVVGAETTKRLVGDEIVAARTNVLRARLGVPAVRSALFYGLPGCGKSYLARAIAGELKRPLHVVLASDVTSQWLGAGVGKIREVFDAAIEQAPCALLIDELDGVAPPRSTALNMHTDERRQVAEFLAQLERIVSYDVVVLATTNYLEGVDSAIRRAGRFDLRIAVLPPNAEARAEIMKCCVPTKALRALRGAPDIDWAALGRDAVLFTPADLRAVVESAIRGAIARGGRRPFLETADVARAMALHSPSVTPEMVRSWLQEVGGSLAKKDRAWLEEEARRAADGPLRAGWCGRRIGFAAE